MNISPALATASQFQCICLEELETDAFEVLDAGAFLRTLGESEADPADEIEGEEGA